MMIDSLLIANRGEIACRIIKTCKERKIRSIAIYSYADRNSKHVREADEAHLLPSDSYLSIDDILNIAKQSGAKSIHPGYGFLSENSTFAKAIKNAGIIFIGPSPEVIDLMGDKVRAKALAESLKVPLIPGIEVDEKNISKSSAWAKKTGYPILVKAAGGGGGRGMKIVNTEESLEENIKSAMKQALTFFSNSTVFLEKLLYPARHIEVQFLGDAKGKVHILSDRDCTLQRKHQKIIEEAPASNLSDKIRELIYTSTTKLAEKAGYVGAGTAEFLISDNKPYFIEVNSRLQVEHPVTESILGVDLVSLQIDVAEGKDVKIPSYSPKGHAIEVRLCAEDPNSEFSSDTGLLTEFYIPEAPSVRVDTGFTEGDHVTHLYDSLLGKIIVYEKDRSKAIAVLQHTLKHTKISGLITNISYLMMLLNSKEFKDITHHVTTAESLIPGKNENFKSIARTVSARIASTLFNNNVFDQWTILSGFRIWNSHSISDEYQIGQKRYHCKLERVDDTTFNTTVTSEKDLYSIQFKFIDNKEDIFNFNFSDVGEYSLWISKDNYIISSEGSYYLSKPHYENDHSGEDKSGKSSIHSPLPGKILSIKLNVGDKILQGDVIAVLESMKMEHPLRATRDGLIQKLHVTKDQTVKSNQLIAEIGEV